MSIEGTNGAHVARATPQRPGLNAPEPEVRSRFEDALNRRDERQPAREGASGQASTAGADAGTRPQQRFDLMQDGRRAPKPPRIEAAAVDAPGVQAAAPASPAATPVPVAAADAAAALPPTHAEFAARLDLPDRVGGGTFHLTMPDTRWIASQAVVATDGSGGLTLDVETRGDGGGDAESRQMLRARLEARGHRITSLTFDPDRRRG